jgi:hypothetical protein
MKASLPYIFEIEHHYETGTESTVPQVGVMNVEMPEISWSDVEVLATWSIKLSGAEALGQTMTLFSWDGNQYLTTSANGRLFMVEDLPNGRRDQVLDVAKIEELYRGSETGFAQKLLLDRFLRGGARGFGNPRSGYTLSSTEAVSARRMAAMATGMIVVEGAVCQKVEKVHIRLPEPWLTSIEIDYTKNGGETWHALGLAANPVRLSLNDDNSIGLFDLLEPAQRSFGDLSVFDAEAVDFDGRHEHQARLMSRILFHVGSKIGDWNTDLLRQWAAIKDAREQMRRGENVAGVMELARRFAEEFPHQAMRNEVALAIERLDRFDQMPRYANHGRAIQMTP